MPTKLLSRYACTGGHSFSRLNGLEVRYLLWAVPIARDPGFESRLSPFLPSLSVYSGSRRRFLLSQTMYEHCSVYGLRSSCPQPSDLYACELVAGATRRLHHPLLQLYYAIKTFADTHAKRRYAVKSLQVVINSRWYTVYRGAKDDRRVCQSFYPTYREQAGPPKFTP